MSTIRHADDNARPYTVRAATRTSIADRAMTGLPPDLLNRVAARLQTLAWLYAFTFFMAAFFPLLLFPAALQAMLQSALNWAPGVISIAFAISVALAIRFARLRPEVVTLLSLVFEVVSSYGIAAAEFLQPLGLNTPSWIGLSWVAVWMLLGDYSRVFSNGSSGPPAEATLNPVVVERPRAPEARVVCCAGSATGALR